MPRTQQSITAADRAAGIRMRELRERWGVSQEQLLPKNRSQVSTVESGSNLLSGPLLLEYAEAFGVQPKDITAYRVGKLGLEELIKRSTKKPDPRAAPPRRGRKPPLPVVTALSSTVSTVGITKEMYDRVAVRLAQRPSWDLARGLLAVHMVKGLTDPSEEGLYHAAIVADLDASGVEFPRAKPEDLGEKPKGRGRR